MGITRAARGALAALAGVTAWPASAACEGDPRRAALDFWLGDWSVSWNGEIVGDNRIEPIVGGCAITERWTDARGRTAFSLFYYDAPADRWKQVFVTDRASVPGGTKEKAEVGGFTTSSRIRFQGEYPGAVPGVTVTDRTTLTRLPDGSIRQLIEVSTDGGRSWKPRFDGHYRRLSQEGTAPDR